RRRRCCSGPCLLPDRSPCARSMDGRASPRSRLNKQRLTSLPDPITLIPPETPSRQFQHNSRRHPMPTPSSLCAGAVLAPWRRRTGLLNRTQYPSDVIALVVLWRLRYKLSLRDLSEMFLIRGIVFSD